jgi:DNA-3-methyladenine glycosylase I
MQAMGLVNDHLEGCHCRTEALRLRAALTPPGRTAAASAQ